MSRYLSIPHREVAVIGPLPEDVSSVEMPEGINFTVGHSDEDGFYPAILLHDNGDAGVVYATPGDCILVADGHTSVMSPHMVNFLFAEIPEGQNSVVRWCTSCDKTRELDLVEDVLGTGAYYYRCRVCGMHIRASQLAGSSYPVGV